MLLSTLSKSCVKKEGVDAKVRSLEPNAANSKQASTKHSVLLASDLRCARWLAGFRHAAVGSSANSEVWKWFWGDLSALSLVSLPEFMDFGLDL